MDMSSSSRRARAFAVIRRNAALPVLASMALMGCYTTSKQAPVPVPLRLSSATDFVLEFSSGAQGATTCAVRKADVDLTELTGDTIRFSAARVVEVAPQQPACAQTGAGRVLVARNPGLRTERVALDNGKTWLAIAVGIPAALATWFVIALATGGWTGT